MVELPFECEAVLATAHRWLGRRRDRFTLHNRDDLAQETAASSWRAWRTLRDPSRVEAFVTTIARRLRFHALRRHHDSVARQVPVDPVVLDRMACEAADGERLYRVGGELVDAEWLLRELAFALADLDETTRAVVSAYYAGTGCREIGGRFGLSESCVKQRLFRARSRVREVIEARARCTGAIDVPIPAREAER